MQLEEWLESKQGQVFQYKMEKIRYALDLLGNPEGNLPIIHVAGTNGKGSTIAFMNQLLQSQGLRVGSFVSPHMVSVHDRICINNQPIADEHYRQLLEQIHDLEQEVARVYEPFRYFEVMVLMMFLYFKDKALDVVLLEVGIGGLLDTTNVVDPLVSVISTVGMDHQDLLGSSLGEIAEQKAGIIKPKRPVVLGPVRPEVLEICQRKAEQAGAPLYRSGWEFQLEEGRFENGSLALDALELGLAGRHQEENAAVALQAFWLFMQASEREIDREKAKQALAQTRWAGRLEQVSQLPTIFLDGAHNVPAVERLVAHIQNQREQDVTILFSALKRKDFKEMLELVQRELPKANLLLTSFAYDGAISDEDVLAGSTYVADYQAFLKEWRKKGVGSLYITGSLYFISQVRKLFEHHY